MNKYRRFEPLKYWTVEQHRQAFPTDSIDPYCSVFKLFLQLKQSILLCKTIQI